MDFIARAYLWIINFYKWITTSKDDSYKNMD